MLIKRKGKRAKHTTKTWIKNPFHLLFIAASLKPSQVFTLLTKISLKVPQPCMDNVSLFAKISESSRVKIGYTIQKIITSKNKKKTEEKVNLVKHMRAVKENRLNDDNKRKAIIMWIKSTEERFKVDGNFTELFSAVSTATVGFKSIPIKSHKL